MSVLQTRKYWKICINWGFFWNFNYHTFGRKHDNKTNDSTFLIYFLCSVHWLLSFLHWKTLKTHVLLSYPFAIALGLQNTLFIPKVTLLLTCLSLFYITCANFWYITDVFVKWPLILINLMTWKLWLAIYMEKNS